MVRSQPPETLEQPGLVDVFMGSAGSISGEGAGGRIQIYVSNSGVFGLVPSTILQGSVDEDLFGDGMAALSPILRCSDGLVMDERSAFP
jgi:hypothetical protein